MGRWYAGILGPVAFAATLARGLVHAAAAEPTLRIATVCLFAFAGLGYVAGQIAEMVVGESVRARFQDELQARGPASPGRATGEARR